MAQAVTVSGTDEVNRALDAVARDVAEMRDTHLRAAQILVPGVTRRSPRRTGALASSWRAEASKIAGAVVSSESYAGPVEYGVPRRRIEARRMVADTIEAESDAVLAEYEAAVAKRGKARGFGVQDA